MSAAAKHRRFPQEDFEESEGSSSNESGAFEVRGPQREDISEDSDDESDAPPETVTLTKGKLDAELKERSQRDLELMRRKKRKTANQAREAAARASKAIGTSPLSQKSKRGSTRDNSQSSKTPATNAKLKKNTLLREPSDDGSMSGSVDDLSDTEPGDHSALARMERAMRQAEEESDDGMEAPEQDLDETDDGHDDHPDEDENKNTKNLRAESQRKLSGSEPVHLPDSYFAAAAAAVSKSKSTKADKIKTTKSAAKLGDTSEKPGRSKARRGTAKEKIVGSRAIRKISTVTELAATGQLRAPPRIRKFVSRKMSGKKSSWARKDAHLAMSAGFQGPSFGFARSAT